MGLKIVNILENEMEPDVIFESMGKGLLLIKICYVPKHPSPYHWLNENSRKPPFDISFHPA